MVLCPQKDQRTWDGGTPHCWAAPRLPAAAAPKNHLVSCPSSAFLSAWPKWMQTMGTEIPLDLQGFPSTSHAPTGGAVPELMRNGAMNKTKPTKQTNKRNTPQMEEFPQLGTRHIQKVKKNHNLLNLIQRVKNKPIPYDPSNTGFLSVSLGLDPSWVAIFSGPVSKLQCKCAHGDHRPTENTKPEAPP